MKHIVFYDGLLDPPRIIECEAFKPEMARLCADGVGAVLIEADNKNGFEDITPHSASDWARVEGYNVVSLARAPHAAALPFIGKLLLAVGLSLLANLLAPKPNFDTPDQSTQRASPNNSLGATSNQFRIGGRVPDIYGRVKSIPDLIATPYRIFIKKEEYEFALMCIGRGEYKIHSSTIKDGQTNLASADSARFFAPNNNPSSGAAQLLVNDDFYEPVYNIIESPEITGKVLTPPNARETSNAEVIFKHPNIIEIGGTNNSFGDNTEREASALLTNWMTIGEKFIAKNAGAQNGIYTCASVATDGFSCTTVENINGLAANEETSESNSVRMHPEESVWGEGVEIGDALTSQIVINLVAPSGLFKTVGDNNSSRAVSVRVEVRLQGLLAGTYNLQSYTITPKSTLQEITGQSIRINVSGTQKVWVRRLTETDFSANQVSDSLHWRDLYALERINGASTFGDVTLVHTRTKASESPLKQGQRKFSVEVTRKIPNWNGTGFSVPVATNSAAHSFIHMALDDKIGRLDMNKIDPDQIITKLDEVQTYFGRSDVVEFNHTLDDQNMTFEQTAQVLATSCFATAYRQGKIRFRPNIARANAVQLFTHRDIIPRSQQYSTAWGEVNGFDGVSVKYQSLATGLQETINIPPNGSAIAPKEVQLAGVAYEDVAQIHAEREWNALKHQHTTVTFTALEKAGLLVINDRIKVANGCWVLNGEGYIRNQSGATLTMSQPFTPKSGKSYHVFLQLSDNTTEVIDVANFGDECTITLANNPRLPLITDPLFAVQTTYIIQEKTDGQMTDFRVVEVVPNGRNFDVTAQIYDEKLFDGDV